MKYLPLILLAIAASAEEPAPPTPTYSEDMVAQVRELQDAVADSKTSDEKVSDKAHEFFGGLPTKQTWFAMPSAHRVEREHVTGEEVQIEDMLGTAAKRLDEGVVPAPDLRLYHARAQSLRDEKRMDFDDSGALSRDRMGEFRYDTSKLTGGVVAVNRWLSWIGTYVGDNFTFATLIHEAVHARDREAGLLTPETAIEGEIRAFKIQHDWLAHMDPSGKRMFVMREELAYWHKKANGKAPILGMAVRYMDHLIEVRDTNGDPKEIRKMVMRLGYQDGHKHAHGDGHDHGADKPEAPHA